MIGAELIAAAYKDAAQARNSVRTGQLIQPALLLIGSSLEAGFKAYLHHNKVSLDRLRDRFRHDLCKLHAAVLKRADAELADHLTVGKPGIEPLSTVGSRTTSPQIKPLIFPT